MLRNNLYMLRNTLHMLRNNLHMLRNTLHMLRNTLLHTTWIIATCALVTACSDDSAPSDTNASESGTETETETETSADTSDTQTDWAEESLPEEEEEEAEEEDDEEGETGEEPIACEIEQSLGEWGFVLAEGAFPNDVPENVDESCTVLSVAADQLTLDCPFAEFSLIFGFTPAPTLTEVGAVAQVQIHHEPGWNNWPDLWITVDVMNGDLFALQASSVAQPLQGDYEVPWEPREEASACGPFAEVDPCGPALGKELTFTVDGEDVSAWHGAHVSTTIADQAFEAWINVAREYTQPPETCDFAPSFVSLVTRRQRAN